MAMDRLAFEAAQAKAEGISYGNWKAKQLQEDTQKRMNAEKKYEKLPICAGCGKPIPKGSRSRKYCGAECADKARGVQTAISKKRKKEAAEPGRCGTCDFSRDCDTRCMCSESQWAGVHVEPDNYCMHYIRRIEDK